MSVRAHLLLIAVLVGSQAFAEDRSPIELGKKTWAGNCAACHYVPDAALRYDRMWLGMIASTT